MPSVISIGMIASDEKCLVVVKAGGSDEYYRDRSRNTCASVRISMRGQILSSYFWCSGGIGHVWNLIKLFQTFVFECTAAPSYVPRALTCIRGFLHRAYDYSVA